MSTIGLLILFSLVAAWCCGRVGSAGGALLFGVMALLLFVATPAGAPLPGHVVSFLQTLNSSTTPHLNGGSGEVQRVGERG